MLNLHLDRTAQCRELENRILFQILLDGAEYLTLVIVFLFLLAPVQLMASVSFVLYHLEIEGGVLDVLMMMICSHQLLKEEENVRRRRKRTTTRHRCDGMVQTLHLQII